MAAIDTDGAWKDAEKLVDNDFTVIKSLVIDGNGKLHFMGFSSEIEGNLLNLQGLFLGEISYDNLLKVNAEKEKINSLLYPNPVENLFYINYPTQVKSWSLYDLSGRLQKIKPRLLM